MEFDIFVHPARDPGCLQHAHTFLQEFSRRYGHALAMLDRDGCGKEAVPRAEFELEIEQRLAHSGWGDRAAAIVLDPELETWVWSDSPEVDAAMGWPIGNLCLRDALIDAGLLVEGAIKPADPMGAMEYALARSRIPRSSSIYGQIAQSVSVNRCEDLTFQKLKTSLQSWFALSRGRSG